MEEHIQDEHETVQTIILWRIYDVLSVLLANIAPDDWEKVMQAHQQGVFITPAPSYRLGEEDG